MSAATLNSSSQYPSYLDNVCVAARSLVAALLAVKPQVMEAQKVVASTRAATRVARAPSLRELYRMSANSDSVNMKAVAGLEAIAAHR